MISAGMESIRALFVGEDHGTRIMGHGAYHDAILLGLARRHDVVPRFVRVGQPGIAGRLLARNVPVLDRLDLDLQPLRWFAVQGRRTRALIGSELRRCPADVVHVNTHALTLGAAPVPSGVPLVLSVDAPVWEWRAMSRTVPVRPHSERLYALCRRLERRALRRAATVVAYTDWARERLRAAAPEAEIVRIRPGVDLDRYVPAAHRPRERHRVVFVGSRFREKGGEDLLAALGDRIGHDVELDVVTHDHVASREGLRQHRLRRDDRELLDLVQQADIFCLPTYADTMSFATIESLACGTPPVVSSVAALPEVVGDAGRVVAPGDVGALRGALDAVLADEGRRRELRARARARAEAHFDGRRQTSLLLDVLVAAAVGGAASEREPSRGAAA
jgi:glycosyltransferase involved in cell wall biosynthesis